MDRLLERNQGYYSVNKRVSYNKIKDFPDRILDKCFKFAYDMTYGELGQHRSYRSGGMARRSNGQIFINTFQGKLAEYGIWNEFRNRNLYVKNPDLREYKLGKWDDFDINYENYNIAVKSTKYYGNLLMLEKKDWDDKGIYIPNKSKGTGYYDFFILIRIGPDGEDIMRKERILYSKYAQREKLANMILNRNINWSYDIPGFITHKDLCKVINEKYIIEQGAILNERTPIDANNYYVQAGCMRNINELFDYVTTEKIKEIV